MTRYYTGGSWSIVMNSSKYFGSEEQLVGCSDVTSIYYPCDFSSENIYSDGNEYYAKKDGIRFTQTISRTNIDNASLLLMVQKWFGQVLLLENTWWK